MAEAKKNYELSFRKQSFIESQKTTYKWDSHIFTEDIDEEIGKKRILRCK